MNIEQASSIGPCNIKIDDDVIFKNVYTSMDEVDKLRYFYNYKGHSVELINNPRNERGIQILFDVMR